MDPNWFVTFAPYLGGGAAGAVITLLFGLARGRRQPIAFRTDVAQAFRGEMFGDANLEAKLTLTDKNGTFVRGLDNLSIATIEMINRGNKDFASFKVGATLVGPAVAMHCAVETMDRFHQAETLTPVGPGYPASEIDFVLAPFNRGDIYKFTLYVVVTGGNQGVGEIRLESPEPVVFKSAPSFSEIALKAARVSFQIGAIKVYFE